MTKPTLLIFARAPAIGVGKTRLARDVGRVEAWRVYRAMSARLVLRLKRDPRWRTVVRIAPDRARWPGAATEGQGGGDLGRRLERAFRDYARGPVLIIGTDAPEVTPERIGRALRALRGAGAVLGPAEDGGYWLIGLSARRARNAKLPGVRWSSPHALEDTLRTLGGRSALLEVLADVDDGEALAAWRRRVQARIDRARAGRHGVEGG